VLGAVGARLGAGSAGGWPSGAAAALCDLGADVTSDRGDGQAVLVVSGCPLAAVVAERPEMCSLMTAFVSAAAGRAANERCDRSGARPQCRFELPDPASCAQR
jgi:predicted ArsR family transcriptional regulator